MPPLVMDSALIPVCFDIGIYCQHAVMATWTSGDLLGRPSCWNGIELTAMNHEMRSSKVQPQRFMGPVDAHEEQPTCGKLFHSYVKGYQGNCREARLIISCVRVHGQLQLRSRSRQWQLRAMCRRRARTGAAEFG